MKVITNQLIEICPIEGNEEFPFPCIACPFYRAIWRSYGDDYNRLTSALARGEISSSEYRRAVFKSWREAVKDYLKKNRKYERCPIEQVEEKVVL